MIFLHRLMIYVLAACFPLLSMPSSASLERVFSEVHVGLQEDKFKQLNYDCEPYRGGTDWSYKCLYPVNLNPKKYSRFLILLQKDSRIGFEKTRERIDALRIINAKSEEEVARIKLNIEQRNEKRSAELSKTGLEIGHIRHIEPPIKNHEEAERIKEQFLTSNNIGLLKPTTMQFSIDTELVRNNSYKSIHHRHLHREVYSVYEAEKLFDEDFHHGVRVNNSAMISYEKKPNWLPKTMDAISRYQLKESGELKSSSDPNKSIWQKTKVWLDNFWD